QLESELQQAENAMSTLIGRPTGGVREMLGASQGIPTAPAEIAVSVPAELLRRRPDIRGAELEAMSQCARVGVAKADLYPTFSLYGKIGTQTSSGGTGSSFSDLFSSSALFYAIGPRILYPLFNYGRLHNAVRVQDARLQQLLEDYRNTVLKAAQEVEDGM